MAQLLKITTIPIEYELKVERARLSIDQNHAKMNISKTPSDIQINTQNIKVNLDTFEYRKSIGLVSPKEALYNAAQIGKQAASEVTGQHASEGNQMTQIQKGANIADIMYPRIFKDGGQLAMMPTASTDISWVPNSIDMKYTPSELAFKWDTSSPKVDYIPGNISMNILTYPSVKIEYVGGPNYVPPSADPNYQEKK